MGPLLISLEWITTGSPSSDDCIAQTLAQVSAMQLKKHATVSEFDQVVKTLTWLFKVCKCPTNWNFVSDDRVHELVAKLRQCAKTIRKVEPRKSREALVQEWINKLTKTKNRQAGTNKQ